MDDAGDVLRVPPSGTILASVGDATSVNTHGMSVMCLAGSTAS